MAGPGQIVPQPVGEQAEVVLVPLSPDAVASPNVERELTIADEGGMRLLPVLVLPCELPAGSRYALAGVQHIDFAHQPHGSALAQLLAALGTPGPVRPARRAGLSTAARRRIGLGASTLVGVVVAVTVWLVLARRGDDGDVAGAAGARPWARTSTFPAT